MEGQNGGFSLLETLETHIWRCLLLVEQQAAPSAIADVPEIIYVPAASLSSIGGSRLGMYKGCPGPRDLVQLLPLPLFDHPSLPYFPSFSLPTYP